MRALIEKTNESLSSVIPITAIVLLLSISIAPLTPGALILFLFGVRPYSCTYTNPGAFTVPPEMAAHIRGAEVILDQATVPRCHCASISYGDTMEITFAGTQAETDTERDFFRFLVREGIPVRVESNR